MYLDVVKKFIREALECSVFVSPRDPGLTFEEIHEIGARLKYQPGEINDARAGMSLLSVARGSKRLAPEQHTTFSWKIYIPEDPEYRNFEAFDFVFTEISNLAKSVGVANAQIERRTLVERAVAQTILENDIEVTLTILLLAETLVEKDGMLRFKAALHGGPLPSQQLRDMPRSRRDSRTTILPIVKDVISRRTDGRPRHAEPFDAFAEHLDQLEYKHFRLWWAQMVSELRRSDIQSSSVSCCVLSAALVEGALTFVVKHARARQLGPFRSGDFDREPRHWRIEELVASAATGGDAGILDAGARSRADALIRSRQRIHAGRMLSEHPSGVPDLRPDEARDAKATAELVVRQILDWLEKFPPSLPSSP
jgi:hypothetical protein